jgi:4-hydroxybenzoate polyprenyltransferase
VYQTSHKLQAFFTLIRLNRPIGGLLLLWPAYWALWLASDLHPTWSLVGVFTAGVWVMRSAGCIVNDWADRGVDGHVARTQHRPLVVGSLTPQEALGGLVVLLGVALGLVLQLNWLARAVAVGALGLTLLYPFMKRITYYPQMVLGCAWGFSVPMAFGAVQNTLPLKAGWLYVAVVCWAIAFDSYYALADWPDDVAIGIKSPAVRWGYQTPHWVLGFHLLALGCLVPVGYLFGLSWPYWAALCAAGVGVLVQYQRVYQACQTHNLSRIQQTAFAAFYQNHWIGFIIFVGIWQSSNNSLMGRLINSG